MMYLISNEERKGKTCHYCGTWLSVKYKIPVNELDSVSYGITKGDIYVCNRCTALHYKGEHK